MEHKYKKYIIFTFDNYYPNGGINDLTGDFDTIKECRERLMKKANSYSYWHYQIVDRDTWEIIEEN